MTDFYLLIIFTYLTGESNRSSNIIDYFRRLIDS